MARMRELKRQVGELLRGLDREAALAPILALDPLAVVGPLLAHLLHPEPLLAWRAKSALGAAAAHLAGLDLEAGRNLMRRFLWHMNEESGNIGWGVPEAMAEALARSPVLARDYARILLGFAHDFEGLADPTWVDHPPLREGVYWGLARLAQARPELVRPALPDLAAALETGPHTKDPLKRETLQAKAHACWALASLPDPSARPGLEALAGSDAPLSLYHGFAFHAATLGALARAALEQLPPELPTQEKTP